MRRDLLLHAGLFVVVNAVYLVLAWPSWIWVTILWAVGLAVHASLVFGPLGKWMSRGHPDG